MKSHFKTTIGVSLRQTEEIKDQAINLEETSSPTLTVDYKIIRPLSIRFPFIKRRIELSHQLGTNLNLGVEFKKRTENDLPKSESSKYQAGFGLEYQIQKSPSIALGGKGEYFDDQLVEGKDYYAYEGSVRLEFRF